MHESENILRILKETREAIENNDSAKVLTLSDQTINTAALTQDPDNIAVAVVVYSLSKIIERGRYREMPGWNGFYRIVTNSLEHAIGDIEKKNEKGFRKHFEEINRAINKISGKLKGYIEEVFRVAKISKGSRIYEHGISMEQTAKLLGITMYELQEYAGQTGISDVPMAKTMDSKSRIKLVSDFFNGK